MSRNVLVVIGTGGMGIAVARRLGSGRHVVLADYSEHALEQSAASLKAGGYEVESHQVDVSDYMSVLRLAQRAAAAGKLDVVVHTAGLSPAQQLNANRIYQVNLLGTACVIQAFAAVAVPNMSLTCIASIAGHGNAITPDFAQHLALAPLSDLLKHTSLEVDQLGDYAGYQAYANAKRGIILRVQAAALEYGRQGARINSISPGFVLTPMGQAEIDGPQAPMMKELIDMSPMKRPGTAEDIANAVAFLASPESCFITGTDIIVDGGQQSLRIWDKRTGPASK